MSFFLHSLQYPAVIFKHAKKCTLFLLNYDPNNTKRRLNYFISF